MNGRGFMDSMYEPNDERDAKVFGKHAIKAKRFEHSEWQTVARVPKDPHDGDGFDCEIDECRMPARFFRLRVIGGLNSVGEPRLGWTMTTGSGDEVARVLVKLAEQVAQGMIGVER